MLVQIYEIQEPGEAEQMIALGVDHIGSVVLNVDDWKQANLYDTIRAVKTGGAKSSLIPLFNDPDAVSAVLDYYAPDIVHFCENVSGGNGTRDNLVQALRIQKIIRERFPEIRIMRSIPIPRPGMADHGAMLDIARRFEPLSDYFLTDTLLRADGMADDAAQPVGGFIGITGETCDWTAAAQLVIASRIPVILAGGISPENAAEGIRQVRPAGVDSCTRTNAAGPDGCPIRFRKDPQKVKALVDSAREAAAGKK